MCAQLEASVRLKLNIIRIASGEKMAFINKNIYFCTNRRIKAYNYRLFSNEHSKLSKVKKFCPSQNPKWWPNLF